MVPGCPDQHHTPGRPCGAQIRKGVHPGPPSVPASQQTRTNTFHVTCGYSTCPLKTDSASPGMVLPRTWCSSWVCRTQ
eukprot:scaffold320846_cov36-Prasinocladus_malaysianus.AAC.1